MNPPQRISSETAHQMGSLQDCNRSALQLVINFSKPTRLHSCATGARDTTKLYYTPSAHHQIQFFACRRARFRRRNFFLRHFHRWLPDFFQAREPLFMVNRLATDMPYMRASGEFSIGNFTNNANFSDYQRRSYKDYSAVFGQLTF